MKGIILNAAGLLCCTLLGAGVVGCNLTDSNTGSVRGACPDGSCGGCGQGCCGQGDCGNGHCSSCGGHGQHGGCTVCNGHDGCDWDLYDKCYPERYWYTSAKIVNAAFSPQVHNGHVLDQTVWAHHFEPGTDKLSPGGQEKLAYLARRRPCPDGTVYLQTADDVCYDPHCVDEFAAAKHDLDMRRVAAIQRYLVAYTAGRPVEFQVLIHDPADPSIAAIPMGGTLGPQVAGPYSIPLMYLRYRGGLANQAGATGGGAAAGGR
jgi:hypothetical protein